jgi:hypothetical protein
MTVGGVGGMSRSNRLFASVIGLLLFIAVQFVIFIDYGVTVQKNSNESTLLLSHHASIHGGVVHDDSNSIQSTTTTTTSSLSVPMKQSEWKHYLKEKYSDVFQSTLKFELISLFTPQLAPDDEPHDPNYHVDNAPRKAVKIYKKWLEMQQEIKLHDDAVRLWKEARRASGSKSAESDSAGESDEQDIEEENDDSVE